jgi:hypothetical protein
MITYGSYSSVKRGSVGGLKSYYFTTVTNHICTVYGNKWLKFDNVSVLSLSLDGGVTYPYSLDLTGVCDIIDYAIICADGTIGWANRTQCFYSTNNLSSYHLSTILDINGSAWTPTGFETYDNFKGIQSISKNTIVGGKQMIVWGKYSIQSGTAGNIWYSTDSFKTIKSAFKIGVTCGGISIRHFEAVDYCPIDNSWWASVGDGGDSGWIQGFYNMSLDTWSWTKVRGYVDVGNRWHTSGFYFNVNNGYAYWASDSGAAYLGFWKAPYSSILDEATYVKIENANDVLDMTYGNDLGILFSNEYLLESIYLSCDLGTTWETKSLPGGPTLLTGGYYNSCHGPDNNNWYRCQIQESTDNEIEYNSAKGKVLMLQIIPTAGSN